MSYSVSWEPKGVVCKFFGVVSPAEVSDMVAEVVKDPRFKKLQYRITDCAEVSQPDVSAGDIDAVVAMDAAYSFANARKYEAAVATNDTVLALLRHWASTSPRQQQLCIFSTLADARRWLLNPRVL